ncbi:MAG: hypothetical protein HY853_02395 [Burkholderiales bacterium]|nr:hypothetical protein [Burkholderiales bacterium]
MNGVVRHFTDTFFRRRLRCEVPSASCRSTPAHPRLVPVCGLVHAHWLNQIEIYFSIVQGKALAANDVADRLENLPGDDDADPTAAPLGANASCVHSWIAA